MHAIDFAYSISLSSGASADDKKWAQATTFALVTAAIGDVAGKKSKSTDGSILPCPFVMAPATRCRRSLLLLRVDGLPLR